MLETLPCCREYSSSETPAFSQEKQSKKKKKTKKKTRFPKHRNRTDIIQKCRNRFTTAYTLVCHKWSENGEMGKMPSHQESGGSARAAGEREGRGRLATDSGDAHGRSFGWAQGARRRRRCALSGLPDPLGNFGAPGRWGVDTRPGGRRDAPRGLREEGEVAAWRARPGDPWARTYGKLARTCLRPEDAWFLGQTAPRQVSLTISSPQWILHLEPREALGSRISVSGREKRALF